MAGRSNDEQDVAPELLGEAGKGLRERDHEGVDDARKLVSSDAGTNAQSSTVTDTRSRGLAKAVSYDLGVPTNPDALLTHAEKLATDLELDMSWHTPEEGYRGYWSATDGSKLVVIRARANRAIAFLQQHAGDQSQWTLAARSVLQSSGENQSMETGARGVGEVVRQWIEEVRAGYTTPRTADAVGARTVASTDLMDQVRELVDDRRVHPAAPIVLAASALEISLRSAVEELALAAPNQPSLNGYMLILRDAGVLNRQDVKDITQIAGVRNAAAHGSFEEISRERAGLLEQQVNLMLSRLPDKVAAAVTA